MVLTSLRAGLAHIAQLGVLPSDDEDARVRKETLTLASLLITALALVWVGTYAALDLWLSAAIPLAYQLASALGIAVFARTQRFPLFRTTQLVLILILPFLLQWSLGGFIESSGVALWALVTPLGALMFQGAREAVPWFVAFLALIGISAGLDAALAREGEGIPEAVVVAFFALNIGGVSLTAFLLLQYFVRARERAHELLAEERERSERLLLNILPEPIAERLKVASGVIAERRDDVSVLFADLAGFTPAVERLPPERAVALLDEIFSTFDDLAAQHGLEKIKTIGDGYMVAGGIPTPLPDHAERVADLALAMRDALAEPALSNGFALRVGVDTGPVVAGVIGRSKFGYDLWGDTVNTASRMESHAPAGAIQVTERTYRRLAGRYVFERRDRIDIKGKGTMTTYLLLGRRLEPQAAVTHEKKATLTGLGGDQTERRRRQSRA
ncbi:MAG: adenylate/guanylate cyclase domain-containing protein [Actinomycetota bacterium]|nr:adenylate/guanylate cyclase domain-containing protein [Actinomycetota bacterium]